MFGLGKKQKEKKLKTGDSEFDSQIIEQVHVMPARFYVAPKKRHAGVIIIIVAGVILIGALVVAGYLLNQGLINPGSIVSPGTNQTNLNPGQTGVNDNSNQPAVNTNQNVNAAVEPEVPTTTPTTTEPVVTEPDNSDVNTNTDIDTSTPVAPAPDIDGDNLSAAEEILYGTDSVNRDSDGDGFSDGSELLNGYDPRQAGKSLADSDLFTNYPNAAYSISYPSRWRVRELAGIDTEVIFQSNSGEFIEVLILPNTNNLSLSQWYSQQFPGTAVNQLTAVKINNLEGLLSVDKLNYYLVNPSHPGSIYLITYNTGNSSQANFFTTFNLMVKSFRLTQ